MSSLLVLLARFNQVIYQTLSGHRGHIGAIDFSEPYGTLVSSSTAHDEGGGARVWDLSSGEELGRLVSPVGTPEVVNCLQVNNTTCLTGGTDAQIRLWDLNKVGHDLLTPLGEADDGGNKSIIYSNHLDNDSGNTGALMNTFCGHAQAISALYCEAACLVSSCSKCLFWIA